MKSNLGYLLSGPLLNTVDTSTSALHVTAIQTKEYDLQRFWTIEASGTSPSCTTTARESIQSYIDSSISRMAMGHTLQDSHGRKTILPYQLLTSLYVKEEHAP